MADREERPSPLLFEQVYTDLHRRAQSLRRRWDGNLTIDTSALVNEAYLKLAASDGATQADRAHFLATASRAMRQVLIDYSRKVSAEKRGGDLQRTTLEESGSLASALDAPTAGHLIDLEAALARLERENPKMARVVECRFYGGMTVEETAQALAISTPTVKRRWAFARSWLFAQMGGETDAT